MKDENLILKGNIHKAILILSIPLMINSIIQTVYNLVDAFWVGRLGAVEFAATTFVSPVIFLFISIGAGLSAAGTSILSQLIGKKRHKDTSNYAYQLTFLALIVSILVAVIGFFLSSNFVSWMGAGQDISKLSVDYLSITFLGFPALMLSFVVASIMQAQGNTKILMIGSIASAIINIFLDPILIFDTIPFINLPGLGLGVSGAAIATILSQYVNALVSIIFFKIKSTIPIHLSHRPDLEKIKDIVKIAFPSIVGQSSASLGFIILNVFISSYGTGTLAAYGVVNRTTNLIMQPTMAIGAGIPAIIGQNMGAKNMDRVKETYHKAHLESFIISIIGSFILFVFAKELVLIFINAKDVAMVLPDAMEYMYFSIPILPLMGSFSIFSGFFLGTGHTELGMKMSMYRLWLIRIPMILVFKKYLNIGATEIWIAMLASNILITLYAAWVYINGRWKNPKIN